MSEGSGTKEQAIEELKESKSAVNQATKRLERAVRLAREQKSSWAEIGKLLGISKQAAQQKYGQHVHNWTAENGDPSPEMLAIEANLTDEDLAGQSVTPSIFLEPTAPAKVQTPAGMIELGPEDFGNGMPKTDTWTEPRKHGAILPGPKPKVAQPGTGKGPHLCPGCQSTNHHGSKRNTIVWNDGCIPTKYDTPAATDYLNGLAK